MTDGPAAGTPAAGTLAAGTPAAGTPAAGTPADARRGRGDAAFALAGIVLLLAVFALDVYRARTQAVTHDEALTYFGYVDGPITRAFGPYMPNDHVLFALLAWISVHALGLSELTLRLPSVIGGLLFLVCALRLSRRAFGRRWISLLAFGLLALNPLVLDFLSAARGYSLAMGFWLWALLQLLDWFDDLAARGALPPASPRLVLASLGVGLSVAGHLTFALPGAGLLLITAGAIVLQRAPGNKVWSLAVLLLPGALVAAAVWLPSLLKAVPARIDYGLPSLFDTSDNLVSVSVAHHAAHWPLDTAGPLARSVQLVLSRLFVPLVLVWLIVQWVCGVWRAVAARSVAALGPSGRFLLLTGGTLLLALAVFVAAHRLVGALYPQDRWGLDLILLFVLVAVALAHQTLAHRALAHRALGAGGWRRLGGRAVVAVLVCVLLLNVAQLQAREYYVWSFDAPAREIFAVVAARHAEHPERPLRLAAMHWTVVPSLNFYRALNGASWMPEVGNAWTEADTDFDCIVVRAGFHDAWAARHLQTIWSDSGGSGVSLAVLRAP